MSSALARFSAVQQSPSEYLRSLIAANGGAISVECFMREALYHPQFGYYANRVAEIGARGDFSTSATLHEALPRAMGAWAVSHRGEVQRKGKWHVIELGGGSGQTAEIFLRALGWFARRSVVYHIVEVSVPLRNRQRERLKVFGSLVEWHTEIATALQAADGHTLIISNEFVDAFPCVQLSRDETAASGWREVMVSWPVSALAPVETLREWNPLTAEWQDWKGFLEPHASLLPRHQKVEIHFSYRRWLESWMPSWRAGRMLTIDYGKPIFELYHRRPAGTLRGYAHHQRVEGEGVYRNFGRQDITADVNFSDLDRWGKEFGAETVGFSTQAEFLRTRLPGEWLRRRVETDLALQFLLDETGAGGAFKVLEQQRCTQP